MTNRRARPAAMALALIAIGGCSESLPNRGEIIEGARRIADCPEYAVSKGGGGAGGAIDPKLSYFVKGSFLVPMNGYVAEDGTGADQDSFLWEVFTRYGEFVKSNINYDAMPNMIAKGGSNKPEPNARGHDFMFVSKEVTVGYDVEWFRGGPNDLDNPAPEVQVIYHVRVN